jgi:hypothetical protein
MNTTIDITKKYRTRDGRAVTGLRLADTDDGWDDEFPIVGDVDDVQLAWTASGKFLDISDGVFPEDLILAEEELELRSPLLTPDPLRTEYGTFVAAVKANFAAGTFATATQEQFDAWLESLTPSLRP